MGGGGSWPPSHGDQWLDGRRIVQAAARGRQRLAAPSKEERHTMAKMPWCIGETKGTCRGRATCTSGEANTAMADGNSR